jgi:hypothetical protein
MRTEGTERWVGNYSILEGRDHPKQSTTKQTQGMDLQDQDMNKTKDIKSIWFHHKKINSQGNVCVNYD